MRDHTALDEVDQNRSDARLHDVSTEHDYDTALHAMSLDYRGNNALEVACYENFRKSCEECAKAPVAFWRRRKLLGANLVRPTLDWNSANLREVRFLV